jgi:lipase
VSDLASYRFGTPGVRPALLAHCFLGHGGTWDRLVSRMSVPLDALAFDLPFHGRSPMPDHVDDFLAEVGALVPGLLAQVSPGGGGVLAMGHSFGGALMLRQAVLAPGTIGALVLIEPVFFAAALGTPEFDRWRAEDAPLQAHLAAGRPDEAARMFLSQNGDGTPWEGLPPRQRAAILRLIALMPGTEPGLIGDTGGILAPGRIEAFDRPVLLLAGAQSPPIYRAICRGLAARLPRADLAIVPGAGHMLPITHAAEVAARIDNWLAGLAA